MFKKYKAKQLPQPACNKGGLEWSGYVEKFILKPKKVMAGNTPGLNFYFLKNKKMP